MLCRFRLLLGDGRAGRGAKQRPPDRQQGAGPSLNTTFELYSLKGVF